jgi:hypothetical protein
MPDHTRLFMSAARVSLITIAAIILSSGGAPPAQSAQSTREARRGDADVRPRTSRESGASRDPGRLVYQPPLRPRTQLPSYQEVAEEFRQLQLRNQSLSQATGRGASLDYALIRAEAAEVKKRASRLKAYLRLPELGKDRKFEEGGQITSPEGLMSAAASLNALVKSFVWNPVFQRPGVVDLELSSKASHDLEGIIRLSEQIRRRAEGLGNVAAKK